MAESNSLMRWKAATMKISCAKIPASSHSAWVWPWSSELAAGWAECDPDRRHRTHQLVPSVAHAYHCTVCRVANGPWLRAVMVRVDLERNQPVRMLNVLHARRGAMPYLEHAVRVGCGEYPLNARRKHQPSDGKEQEEHAHAARSSLVAKAGRAPAAKLGVKKEEPWLARRRRARRKFSGQGLTEDQLI